MKQTKRKNPKYGIVKYRKVIIVEFDAGKEYKRIMKVFRGKERENMLDFLEMLVAEDIDGCEALYNKLLKNYTKKEYREAEHIGIGAYDLFRTLYSFMIKKKTNRLRLHDVNEWNDLVETWESFERVND